MAQSVIERTSFSKPVNGPLFPRMQFPKETFGTATDCGERYTHFNVISQSHEEITLQVEHCHFHSLILKDFRLTFSLDMDYMQTVTLTSGNHQIDVDTLPELLYVLLEKFIKTVNYHYSDAFTHRQGLLSELKIKTK